MARNLPEYGSRESMVKLTDLDTRGHTRGQVKVFCPLCHKGRRHQYDPSLSVNLDTGAYTCHNCDAKGGLEDVRSGNYAAKPKKEYKTPEADSVPQGPADPQVVEYFAKRGISEATLGAWRISYGPSFGVYDYDAPRTRDGKTPLKRDENGIPVVLRGIQFPFLEGGTPVNMKYLLPREWAEDGERQFRAFAGGKPIPFGLDNATGGRIVIVEGEIDALSVYEAGIHEVWSMPNGAKNLEWLGLPEVVDRLMAAGDIYLAGDNDADGRACREELVRRLSQLVGPEKLSLVNWPAGCKDANDTLVRYGPERLKEIVQSEAEPLPLDGISYISEFVPEYLDFYVHGIPKGVSTGVAMTGPSDRRASALDPLYRVMPGMFTILSGVTNYGKSEIMDEVVRCMIEATSTEEEPWKFAFYSPENFPLPLHMIKIAEKRIGKPFDTSKPGHMSQDEAVEATEWMQRHLFYINPRNQTYSIEEILERAQALVYREGIRGLIIDPWNYVRKDFGGFREDQYINECMQKIGIFCKRTNVHVWLTVHPRTLRRDKNDKIQVPNVMDLSGGSKFGDNADFFLVVHRDPQEAAETGIHKVTVFCQKSRYRYAAIQGFVDLEWNPFNGRFSALGEVMAEPGVEILGEDVEHTFENIGTSSALDRPTADEAF